MNKRSVKCARASTAANGRLANNDVYYSMTSLALVDGYITSGCALNFKTLKL